MSDTTGTANSAHPVTRAAEGHWVLDPAGSSVRFACKGFWGMANVKGTFGDVDGQGDVQGGAAQGTLTLKSASLDTKNAKRDKHLRSGDFFDAENHPEVVFTARSLTPAGADAVEV
ncbi:YceI family protein, partial [Actinacidiphila rubida]